MDNTGILDLRGCCENVCVMTCERRVYVTLFYNEHSIYLFVVTTRCKKAVVFRFRPLRLLYRLLYVQARLVIYTYYVHAIKANFQSDSYNTHIVYINSNSYIVTNYTPTCINIQR
jgi:hypothetical protein|uniref:Uncharacterized protein n=1 Tax=Sipha flava TaxID=143950 RepID=A0A2S2QF63_9HEMI